MDIKFGSTTTSLKRKLTAMSTIQCSLVHDSFRKMRLDPKQKAHLATKMVHFLSIECVAASLIQSAKVIGRL